MLIIRLANCDCARPPSRARRPGRKLSWCRPSWRTRARAMRLSDRVEGESARARVDPRGRRVDGPAPRGGVVDSGRARPGGRVFMALRARVASLAGPCRARRPARLGDRSNPARSFVAVPLHTSMLPVAAMWGCRLSLKDAPRELRLWRTDPDRHSHTYRGELCPDCFDCTHGAHRGRDTIFGDPAATKALKDLCLRTPLQQEIAERIAVVRFDRGKTVWGARGRRWSL